MNTQNMNTNGKAIKAEQEGRMTLLIRAVLFWFSFACLVKTAMTVEPFRLVKFYTNWGMHLTYISLFLYLISSYGSSLRRLAEIFQSMAFVS